MLKVEPRGFGDRHRENRKVRGLFSIINNWWEWVWFLEVGITGKCWGLAEAM
jgi:hypothetical protein